MNMLSFELIKDPKTNEQWIETAMTGKALLNSALLNKGTAFTMEERHIFDLTGKLPAKVETLEEQMARAYEQYKRYQTDLSRNIYLNNLRDRNETLFYALLKRHIAEMMPIIYTPIVGTAVKEYSREFRSPRGLYIGYEDKDQIRDILKNRTHPHIDLMVVSDGGGVLGIGDQGVGAMDIPIAKLMVYSLFAGIHPSRTLPIMLDVGTDNQTLLQDPFYLGRRHPRVSDAQYDEFIELFVKACQEEFPHAFLHWEDLGQRNAQAILKNYRLRTCTFNDDIQGTGVVTVAALLAASDALKLRLDEHRMVVFGAGTAGMGIVEQIVQAMQMQGTSLEAARACFWLLDKPGLLTVNMALTDAQRPYAKQVTSGSAALNLYQVVEQVKPTVLIGASAVPGAFTKEVIQQMAAHCKRPIIFPLSNPTERMEAHPKDLLDWTKHRGLIATGSPFENIAQSNNAFAFPGIGLGVIAARATTLSDTMLWKACQVLSQYAPIHHDPQGAVLPALIQAREISHHIAEAVALQAVEEGVSPLTIEQVQSEVQALIWEPRYLPFKLVNRGIA